jgi:hypothetical protein
LGCLEVSFFSAEYIEKEATSGNGVLRTESFEPGQRLAQLGAGKSIVPQFRVLSCFPLQAKSL